MDIPNYWLDWLSNNDHWMVIGTLILAGTSIIQVVIARKTAKRQLRAYLLVDTGSVYDASKIGLKSVIPATVLLPEWKNWAATDLVLKNSGQTPASHVVHWAMMAVADSTTESALSPPALLEESQATVVGPGQVITKTVVLQPFPLAEPVLSEIISHRKGIYVYGKIEYRDIFKRKRTTTYRLRYTGDWPPMPSGTFQFSLNGNDFT